MREIRDLNSKAIINVKLVNYPTGLCTFLAAVLLQRQGITSVFAQITQKRAGDKRMNHTTYRGQPSA